MKELNAEIVLLYFMGTVGMMLLAGALFYFFNTYNKRLLKKQLELERTKQRQQAEIIRNTLKAQEKERSRIARDLHDEVGAMLSVVKLNMGRIEKRTDEAKAKSLAGDTKAYVDEVIMQVRRISRALLPPSLEKLGLYCAVEELAEWVNKSDQLSIRCWKNGELIRFESKTELGIFRILQELINNAIKHANASQINVNFRFSEKGMGIVVSDNGTGFKLKEMIRTGLGLKNLESRSEMLGANFKMKSEEGKGTKAIIFLAKEE